MSDLPSREDAKDWSDRYAEVVSDRSMVRIVAAYASGRLVDRDAMTPMYRQGGMSGAWYRETDGDPPDGWLAIEDAT